MRDREFSAIRITAHEIVGYDNGSGLSFGTISAFSNNSTLILQTRDFSLADNAVEISKGTYSNVTGQSAAVAILPTYNQTSGDAANTDLLINRTQTATGSGEQLLLNLQVDGVSKFHVHADGTAQIGGGENIHTINGIEVKSVFEVHSEGGAAAAGLSMHNHGNSAAAGTEFTLFRSRGTHEAPTAVVNGTIVGRVTALPYDGVDHNIGAQLSFVMDGTPAENDSPTAVVFATAKAGENTTTERVRIKPTGELNFTNGGGLAYGCMHGYDVASALTITASGKANKVQVTAFAANGPSSPSVTPDHTNDHMTILVAGVYKVDIVLNVQSEAGLAFDGAFSAFVNNGATEITNLHAHHDFAGGGGDYVSIPMTGLVDLAVNDTLEIWGWNETNTVDMTIDEISMNITLVGAA